MAYRPLETLVTGCGLIEGPRVDDEDRLYYSDVHKGGVFRRWPDGRVETVVPKRRGVGGIALHVDGGVVVSGRNLCHVRDGVTTLLCDSKSALGYNDLQPDSQGRVYVGEIRYRLFENEAPVPGALVRVDGPGKASEVYSDVLLANGIGFSPDNTQLYQSDTRRNQILVHDLTKNGQCSNRRVFAKAPRGRPDGLAVDADGGVWIAAYGGGCVSRFAPDGTLERHLEVPSRSVTSLCFGGSDLKDLYISTADNADDASLRGCVFRTRVDVRGQKTPLATI